MSQSSNESEKRAKVLLNLDMKVDLIAELSKFKEVMNLKQRKQQEAKLFDVTPEQVDDPNYWINL